MALLPPQCKLAHRKMERKKHTYLINSILANIMPPEAMHKLYFMEIKIGTPLKRYRVKVDTGSDILSVDCISCEKRPHKSGLGVTISQEGKESKLPPNVPRIFSFCVIARIISLPALVCAMNTRAVWLREMVKFIAILLHIFYI